MAHEILEEELLASAGRLRILRALAAEGRQEFVQLRGRTRLTDGNLATHTRRLEAAGFVAVEKSFRDRKPVTQLMLTASGRAAMERHVEELMQALQPRVAAETDAPAEPFAASPTADRDDWID
jgi:DNA-binding MarR family transcriptional regulator